jgi:hypothetical protein
MDLHWIAETAAWLDTLYGRCRPVDGFLVVIASCRRKIVGVFPMGDPAELVRAAKLMHEHPGCYAKINPMNYAAMLSRAKQSGKSVVGNKDEVQSIVSFHLDVDAGKSAKYPSRPKAIWAVRQMPIPPTMIINSGGANGGFHVYWVFEKPHQIEDREYVQSIAKKWQDQLKRHCDGRLDSTCNLDRVLRCVGVPRKDGRHVMAEECDFSNTYELADFA